MSLPEGVLIDQQDQELVSQFKWHIAADGYVTSDTRKTIDGKRTGSMTLLHRLLLGLPKGEGIVDHINRNPLDNRRSNLRLSSKSENGINRTAQSNSTTGFKGISWSKQKNKWRAYATRKGKQYHLGFYATLEEAVQGYNQRIESVHGELAVKHD